MVEPSGFVYTLASHEYQYGMIDYLVLHPTRHHRYKPFLEALAPVLIGFFATDDCDLFGYEVYPVDVIRGGGKRLEIGAWWVYVRD